MSPVLAGVFFTTSATWEAHSYRCEMIAYYGFDLHFSNN